MLQGRKRDDDFAQRDNNKPKHLVVLFAKASDVSLGEIFEGVKADRYAAPHAASRAV